MGCFPTTPDSYRIPMTCFPTTPGPYRIPVGRFPATFPRPAAPTVSSKATSSHSFNCPKMQCRLPPHYVAARSRCARCRWFRDDKPVDIHIREAACIQAVSRLRKSRWRLLTDNIKNSNFESTAYSKSPKYSRPRGHLLMDMVFEDRLKICADVGGAIVAYMHTFC